MEHINILTQLFEVVLIPLLALFATFMTNFIKEKIEELKEKHNNELTNKYLTMLSDTIISCVIATNQTYVETLKKEGKFDLEAQKKAFEMTKKAVLNILTDDAKEYLSSIFGDLEEYINQKIESSVYELK